jgi:S1-C subfamily serine protease
MWVTVGSGEGRGLSVHVEGARFVVGTAPECQLMLGDPKVSPLHAYFEVLPEGHVLLHDLGSDRGTFVDGERINGGRRISGGEEIHIGETTLIPSLEEPAREAERADGPSEPAPAVRVQREGQTVEVVPSREGDGDGDAAVIVTTEGEAVDVVGAGERRRLRDRLRLAIAVAAVAAAGAVAAIVLAVTGSGSAPSTAAIVRYARPRTVLVRAVTGPQTSSGSGIVLDAGRGLIVTNFHVVDGGSYFKVGFPGDLRDATLVGAAPCEDLAVLKTIEPSGLKAFPLGSQSKLSEGDHVVAVGFPANASLGTNLTSTEGVVAQVRTTFRAGGPLGPHYPNVVQTDASLAPGNSGGPLVDAHERVIGLSTAILTDVGGAPVPQGYAIGIDRVKQVVPGLAAGRSRGWAGFGIQPVPPQVLARHHLPPGIVAGAPVPGTPAAQMNVGGVLVTAIDGHPLNGTLSSYCAAIGSAASGHVATLTVIAKPGDRPQKLSLPFP